MMIKLACANLEQNVLSHYIIPPNDFTAFDPNCVAAASILLVLSQPNSM